MHAVHILLGRHYFSCSAFHIGLLIRSGHQRVGIIRQKSDVKIIFTVYNKDYASVISDGW